MAQRTHVSGGPCLVPAAKYWAAVRSTSAGGLLKTRPTQYHRLKRQDIVPSGVASQPGVDSDTTSVPATVWVQKVVELPPFPRGCHVITKKLVQQLPELSEFEVGLANIFVQHTSASLTINENASPDVPLDLNDSLDKIVPEGNHYRHLDEGMDDMPAHVKSSLMGASLCLPIQHGRFALGIWQGIYLNEHRNYGGARRIVVTIQGQKRADGRKYSGYR